jgi:hypothetical protein
MPAYDYYCEANGRTVEVQHPMSVTLGTWGEVCHVAQLPLGDTDPLAPVHKVIHAPYVISPIGMSKLRETGFTKLVRRDDGIYENVTAKGDEPRIIKPDDPSTLAALKKKVGD